MTTAGSGRERNPIASVARVLGALAEQDGESVGVRELARMLGAAPSSVQRTLESAREVSLVETTSSGQWELGWELYRIAAIAQSKRPFQAAAEVLDVLAGQTGETTVLTVVDPRRKARMFVAAAQSKHGVRFVPELFTWLPAYGGASAKAILAYLSSADREAIYSGAEEFGELAPLPDIPALERELEGVRQRGYAISHDEINLGASAVAAPVSSLGRVLCSVAVVSPNQRFEAVPTKALVEQVLAAAAAISGRIGDPLASLRGVS